jgi:hypothetical protein
MKYLNLIFTTDSKAASNSFAEKKMLVGSATTFVSTKTGVFRQVGRSVSAAFLPKLGYNVAH